MFKNIKQSFLYCLLIVLSLSFVLLTVACDDSDSGTETTEKAPFPVAPAPEAVASPEAGAPPETEAPPETGGGERVPGSYRGLHTVDGTTNQRKPVFRWTKPGGQFPDGLVVRWNGGSQRISDTSQFQSNYRCPGLHWNPRSKSTTEWGGKLVVMLDCKFAGVKECWLEY